MLFVDGVIGLLAVSNVRSVCCSLSLGILLANFRVSLNRVKQAHYSQILGDLLTEASPIFLGAPAVL